MNTLFEHLGGVVVRFRYLIVLIWIVLVVVLSRSFPSLSSEVNNDNSQFLPANAPSSVAADLASPLLGNPHTFSQIIVVGARSNGRLGVADQAALTREARALDALPRVATARVVDVSSDGHAAQILVQVRVNQADVPTQTKVITSVIGTFARVGAPPGLTLHVAGPIATNVANQQNSARTSSRLQSFSFLFIIVFLILIFRSLLAPLATLIPPAIALLVASRFIGILGAHGVKISQITQLLLIVLLIGAGTDYGLFLVFRVREELRAGLEPHAAVRHALVRVGESISASAGTVIFALLSLLLASFGIYKDLGIPLAIGMLVMLCAGLTLLPALLAIFGRALLWPWRSARADQREGYWGRVAARLVRRPALTLATGVLAFAGFAVAATGYHSGGFGGALNAPAGTDAAAGNALLTAHFPQASTNPANLVFRFNAPVWQDATRMYEASIYLSRSGQFRQFSGPFDPNGTRLTPEDYVALHRLLGPANQLPAIEAAGLATPPLLYNAYRASAAFVSPDGRTVQFAVTLKVGDQGSTAALAATPKIRALVARAATRSHAEAAGLAGEASALYDVSSTSNSDLVHIVPVATLAIGILLAFVLRSAIAPLYLIVSVVLSYLAALGVSTIVFIDIGGQGGLTFILPFLMFIFLLALGEDYNILVMTRIREEAHRHSLHNAVIRAVGRSGPTVTAAGLVLAGSFGVLAVVGGSGPGGDQIRAIGFGLAIGILMDTFLVRTLLVPSTVALLGRWNWWPGRLSRDKAFQQEDDAKDLDQLLNEPVST